MPRGGYWCRPVKRVAWTLVLAVAFVPLVLLLSLFVAGIFARIWWRVLRELWR
jgi:hypothetical protein